MAQLIKPSAGALRAAGIIIAGAFHRCQGDIEIAGRIIDRETGIAELLEAAKSIWKLIETGDLVRNISRDDESNWAIRQIPLVQAIKQLEQAIAKVERSDLKGDRP